MVTKPGRAQRGGEFSAVHDHGRVRLPCTVAAQRGLKVSRAPAAHVLARARGAVTRGAHVDHVRRGRRGGRVPFIGRRHHCVHNRLPRARGERVVVKRACHWKGARGKEGGQGASGRVHGHRRIQVGGACGHHGVRHRVTIG